MAIPQTKDELTDAVTVNFDSLMRIVRKVPADRITEKSLDGHAKDTQMSVKDLLAYLTGWNELVIKWLEKDRAGEPIDFPETGFKWNELGRLAQKFYRDYDALTYEALLLRLQAAKETIIQQISERSDEALYGAGWYDKWTMGRMIQFNTSSPYKNACGRLRKWLKTVPADKSQAM
ncbi:ClbS/DfsB family four-helix bundle protein [Pseudochrobactrum sp. XF203]|uniref:ClbS/DfsB family four-helix bundle protein n=1 Tax=Pseudochrobactrum sp. XF203 TaxID=2879116 RepID=UPI001CE24894|nr:ClbS/DfsB family four-helix bundle protein [Pseudochrobactrum sp. XF203]UCA45452.1 ClbS/DfsB family four-helix bundle protein [Pseudochrobactrum sp. XF203]